ncbi:ABC transporter permease [Pediococcus acidilactici]
MSKLNFGNLAVLLKIKFKLLVKNFSAIVGSVLAIFFSIVFKNTLPEASFAGQKGQFILTMTVLFNAVVSAIMMVSIPMAEEKEKKSLKVLVTSTIGENEYLLATIIPPFIVIMITNFILPMLSGVKLNVASYWMYILITFILTLISMLIGLVVGIASRKISDTSYFTVPLILPLILIPQLSSFSDVFKHISEYLYTGILYKALEKLVSLGKLNLNAKAIIILIIEVVIFWIIFAFLYKKKGLKS